jgi:GNAT superfamily N-acetyltransferase
MGFLNLQPIALVVHCTIGTRWIETLFLKEEFENMSAHTLNHEPTNTITNNLSRSMALNLADWHRSSVQHFGLESYYTPSLWWRQPGGSGIYLGALIHDAQASDEETFAELQAVERVWGTQGFWIYDCWGTRDLTPIDFEQVVKNPWYLRAPGAAPTLALPEGLSVEIARTPQQLADFERETWEGFEEPENPEEAFQGRETFSQHPVGTLEDAGMYYLNARLDGEVVAGVIIHTTEDMLGVYGISTLPRFRRRGYAAALVRAALALRPDLPMSVFPDPVSLPIYSIVGFEPAGEIAIWKSSKAT